MPWRIHVYIFPINFVVDKATNIDNHHLQLIVVECHRQKQAPHTREKRKLESQEHIRSDPHNSVAPDMMRF